MLRLLREGRTRLLVIAAAMAAWFALILGVTRTAAADVQAKTELFDSALTRGFGLGSLASPDLLLAQLVGVSFNHPILLALVGAVTVGPGARACQGELRAGTLDVTLARPLSRTRYLLGYALVMLLESALLMLVAFASMVGFEALFDVPGTLHLDRAAALCLVATLVFASFGAIAMLVSVLLGRRGNAVFVSIGVLIVMFAITFARRAWDAELLDLLDRASVFRWLDASGILLGVDVTATDVLAPTAIIVGCIALAAWRFERRDL